MAFFPEFEVWPKFYLRMYCIVCNIVLYFTWIYRRPRAFRELFGEKYIGSALYYMITQLILHQPGYPVQWSATSGKITQPKLVTRASGRWLRGMPWTQALALYQENVIKYMISDRQKSRSSFTMTTNVILADFVFIKDYNKTTVLKGI